MKTVYFVRHGESEGNVGNVFQGADTPLTERGKQQAIQIAQRVATLPIEAMLVSSMTRTKETAEAITKETGWQPEISDLFVERKKPSSLNYRPMDDLAAQELNMRWEESLFTPGQKVEDGENFDELTERAREATSFLENHPNKHILVVTHGFFLRTMLAHMLFGAAFDGERLRDVMQGVMTSNTGLTVFRYTQEPARHQKPWRLITWNDHAHLADPGA